MTDLEQRQDWVLSWWLIDRSVSRVHWYQLCSMTDDILSLSKGLNVISHLPSNVSFSIRSQRDIVQLTTPSHQEFDHYEISIRTRSSSGFLTSFYSTVDHRALRLSLVQGRLQINYERSKNVTSHIIFNDYRTIDDGQPHQISLQRMRSIATASPTFRLQVDQHVSSVSIPDRSTLYFDQLIIGGLSRSPSNQTFIGCLANVVYNHHPLVPREMIPADRHDCFYRQDSMCDRRIPCSTSAVPFCGDSDCSLVCPGIVRDIHQKGLVRYYSRIGSSPTEEISLMIFTTSSNATLLFTFDGSTQVSIILQVNFIERRSLQPLALPLELPSAIAHSKWSSRGYLRVSWSHSRWTMVTPSATKNIAFSLFVRVTCDVLSSLLFV